VVIVTLMAISYGAKASTGILMPLLVVGDIFAISYYRKEVQWHYIKKLMPTMVLDVLLGLYVGERIPALLFKIGMLGIIISSVVFMLYWDSKKEKKVPTHWSFAASFGILSGFTTMIGNLAGAFTSIYFLAHRLPKAAFIGTAAWLFFIINIFKIPFHIWVWETITWDSLTISLKLLPALVAGLVLGVVLVKRIQEHNYRVLILYFTLLGSIFMLLN
jgi:uncharacterized membrane protein YfcA